MSCTGLEHDAAAGAAFTCRYCQVELDCRHRRLGLEPVTIDHRVPVMRGGEPAGTNVVPACHGCNAAKGLALWPGEWTRAAGLDPSAVKAPAAQQVQLSARAFGTLVWLRESGADRVLLAELREVFSDGAASMRRAVGELYVAGHVVPDVFGLRGMSKVGLRMAVTA